MMPTMILFVASLGPFDGAFGFAGAFTVPIFHCLDCSYYSSVVEISISFSVSEVSLVCDALLFYLG